MSLFGHTFLVFHQEKIPEPDAPVLEFIGLTKDASAPVLQAMTGTLPGIYQGTCFQQKHQEYDQEDRDLWLFRLNLTREERLLLNEAVVQHWTNSAPYGFFRSNCAERIYAMLAELRDERAEQDILAHLPLTGLRRLNRLGLLEAQAVQIASSFSRFRDSFTGLNAEERSTVSALLSGVPLSSSSPAVMETISRYVSYRVRKEADPEKRQRLFRLKQKTLAIDGVDNGSVSASSPSPLITQGLTEFRASMDQQSRLLFRFTPGGQNFWNHHSSELPFQTLEFLVPELTLDQAGIKLESFTLLRLEHLARPLEAKGTRYIELGVSSVDQHSKVEARFGYGYTSALSREASFSIVPFLGTGYYETQTTAVIGGNPGLRARLGALGPLNTRYQMTWESLLLQDRGPKQALLGEAVLFSQSGRNLGFTLQYEVGKNWSFSLSFSFAKG